MNGYVVAGCWCPCSGMAQYPSMLVFLSGIFNLGLVFLLGPGLHASAALSRGGA
jgi:hypothetical protein